FFRRTALKFFEIRAYSCKISPCAAKKSLKNPHTGIFQTRPSGAEIMPDTTVVYHLLKEINRH
ncbi:MAG: hypothetical protein FWF05_01985, partial [Oscillospiraceae bacterium]|nr:hypothetical protein [Oscillospiraceae bacterium]